MFKADSKALRKLLKNNYKDVNWFISEFKCCNSDIELNYFDFNDIYTDAKLW